MPDDGRRPLGVLAQSPQQRRTSAGLFRRVALRRPGRRPEVGVVLPPSVHGGEDLGEVGPDIEPDQSAALADGDQRGSPGIQV
jgi:hypothetical protein